MSEELLNIDNIPSFDDQKDKFFSNTKFTDFGLSDKTQKSLDENKFQKCTYIQEQAIPYLLQGKNILGAAKTGSGKTLAFLIPVIENLYRNQFTQSKGTGAIIIAPTRELARQIFDVCDLLVKHHSKTVGLLIGGVKRYVEAQKLQKGIQIIIATPGRLLDHLENTKFKFDNLEFLVIDEADQILKQGFEQELNKIISILPQKRQTAMFSATQTKKVHDLTRINNNCEWTYIGTHDSEQKATVEQLEQGFVQVDQNMKFQTLLTFIKQQINQSKCMIFFSSCSQVQFYTDLLKFLDFNVMSIHGKQKQAKRTKTYFEFSEQESAILLCTDVAARGLDLPNVDFIFQYDAPDSPQQYIHRVGRTCRGINKEGKAIILLYQEELQFLAYLKQHKVDMSQYEISIDFNEKLQNQFESFVGKNYYLRSLAFQAYKSYLFAYNSFSIKDVFNVNKLDLHKIGKNFGFKIPPNVNLNLKLGGRNYRKINKGYLKNSNDKRQFSR